MEPIKQKGHRTENTDGNRENDTISVLSEFAENFDEATPNNLFGIDYQGDLIHKEAWLDVRTNLINLNFYFECASDSVNKILAAMERVKIHDTQKKANDDERRRHSHKENNS